MPALCPRPSHPWRWGWALALALGATAQAASPKQTDAPRVGVFALPAGAAKVTATLQASPGLNPTLDVAMTPIGSTRPVTRYDTELSKKLHLIAVSADLHDFVHVHGEAPDAAGHFHVAMHLPHAGLWRVYADATPQGLGQQVLRFDLPRGGAETASSPALALSGLVAASGRYGARFDALDLKAGEPTQLSLHLSRDGRPAPDITPFLGVAAHAVFIDSADLSYVHVHAMPAGSPAMAMADHDHDHGTQPALSEGARVGPDLALHVLAPKAGVYVLWLQFEAGGAVRTVRFVTRVA